MGVPIITLSYEELDTLPKYEITSRLFWYPYSKLLEENDTATKQGVTINAWKMTNISNWKKVLHEECGIKISQT